MTTPTGAASLADRKRGLVHAQITDAGLRLVARQGFDETTVEEIAAAAGVSRRTFFRYFPSKEDVVVDFLGHLGESVAQELAARPGAETWPVALERAFGQVLDGTTHDDPDKPRRLAALVLGHPGLRSRYLERQDRWRDLVAQVLVDRSPGAAHHDAVTTAAVAVAAFDVAVRDWVAGTEADPRPAVARAFAAVRAVWWGDAEGRR